MSSSLYARTDETHDPKLFAELPNDRQKSARGIEVGQIFYFGTKWLGTYVVDDKGNACSYGVSWDRRFETYWSDYKHHTMKMELFGPKE